MTGRFPPSRANPVEIDGKYTCLDCDDWNDSVNPGALELPGNDLDENCDGVLACDPKKEYTNHGQFVGCVRNECRELVESGDLTKQQCNDLIQQAAMSDAG